MESLVSIFCKNGAADAGIIQYSDCEIINHRLAEKIPFQPQSVCIGILPYYTHYCDTEHTVSSYALAYDYHELIRSICENILKDAKEIYPNANFVWFGDHSPINEKTAAAKAGLGIIGKHSLLITPDYSSYVFLFEIITDLEFDVKPKEVRYCESCGECIKACPVGMRDKSVCLSALTQKKGELNPNEAELIKRSGCAWGCDICQAVCPHTSKAIKSGTIYSSNPWFYSNINAHPDRDSIADIVDFNQRAYSWRGTATILRNIDIIKEQ